MNRVAIIAGVLVAVVAGALVAGGSRGASVPAVERCLQGRLASVTSDTSSTGTPELVVTHGSASVAPSVTLESSRTYVAFLPSPDEAEFFEEGLQGVVGSEPALVASRGNVLVTFGSTARSSERAAILSCL